MTKEDSPQTYYVPRTSYTYKIFLEASSEALTKAQNHERGYMFESMFSMIFSSFALEAFLNHLGQFRFGEKNWSFIEQGMSPKGKLCLLAEFLGYDVDFGSRPCQTFTDIFKYRNTVAHATTTFKITEHESMEDALDVERLHREDAEEMLNKAKRFHDDARELVSQMAGTLDVSVDNAVPQEWYKKLRDEMMRRDALRKSPTDDSE